jgi:2-polyprenyl-3-methyl-5-hydroxy-6-metoxy-1,4-benzoquinol methylase
MFIKKLIVILLKQLDLGSAVAVRLTKLSGKSKEPIHPKHFLTQKPWFTKYLRRSDIILDLGCGNGQNTIKASKNVKRVVGIDINESMINSAKRSSQRLGIENIKFETADLGKKLKYQSNSFDKIMFLDVLEHLMKRNQMLKEVKRVLKPQGWLLLVVPNNQTSWKKLQRSVGLNSYSDPTHKIEFSEKGIRSLLNKHRFKIEYFGYDKFDTPLRGLFDIIGGISLTLYKKLSNWRREKTLKFPQEASGFEIVAVNTK